MSNLSAYLAKNYLTASRPTIENLDSDGRPKKKRKKDKSKVTAENTLLIADDEDLLLNYSSKGNAGEEDDVPVFENNVKSAEFRKSKKNLWKSVSEPEKNQENRYSGGDEAEQILKDAAAESERRRQDQDSEDAPAIVDTEMVDDDDISRPKMESGVRAGLQTAADTARLLEKEERERAAEKRNKKPKKDHIEEETIYRDATGRRIDVSMKRAEARAAEIEKLKQQKKEREEAMGDVQRRMKEDRKQELEDAKFLTIGRSAEDEEMNEQLKEVVRWDDPMAAYMAEKAAESRPNKSSAPGSISAVKKKVYQGHAPPNRYGILPGWRWDGVDRGNGFEKDWFQARSRKARNENLEYQWQMDE